MVEIAASIKRNLRLTRRDFNRRRAPQGRGDDLLASAFRAL
jgi:hypothetical protein